MLEIYALRASLGSLALQKLMLEDRVPEAALERELGRCAPPSPSATARRAADADLGYQSAIIAASGLAARHARVRAADLAGPRVPDRARDRLRGQARRASWPRSRRCTPRVARRDAGEAETLWRVKYERWVRDLVALLPETFDEALWTALTRAA